MLIVLGVPFVIVATTAGVLGLVVALGAFAMDRVDPAYPKPGGYRF